MNAHQKLAIRALHNMIGDDAIRARNAFVGCTSEQMQQQYGQSGKTRQQILDEYKAHDAKCFAAIDWIEAQS